jgi:hypothetical protein
MGQKRLGNGGTVLLFPRAGKAEHGDGSPVSKLAATPQQKR